MGEAHHHHNTTPLGLVDVLAGAVFFIVLALLLKAGLDSVVPGLLREDTLRQIIVSGCLFLVVWAYLGNYVFKPFFSVLEEREARTSGDEKKAQERVRQSKSLTEKIEEELLAARLEGIRRRDALIEEAKGHANSLLEAGTKESEARIATARAEIESHSVRARSEVTAEAEKLAAVVRQRVLDVPSDTIVH